MNIFSAVVRAVGKGVGWFLGMPGSGTGKDSPINTVAKVVDEYKYTDQEKEETYTQRAAQDSADTARIMTADSRSGVSPFDIIVDAINRLQRPGWGVYFLGAFSGWWNLPDLSSLPQVAFWTTTFTIYFTALFGGRALFKDLAGAVMNIINIKK